MGIRAKQLLIVFFIFSILLCIPIIGCNDDDDNDTDTIYIMPLAVGNTWNYVANVYDGSSMEFQWKVFNTQEINGEEVYHVGLYDPALSDTWFLKNHVDGLYAYGSSTIRT